MIKKITLHNIQSHKDSELELDKGINVIIGSSNNGKSAILRGLYWTKYNRPLGIDTLLSHWSYDDKGNQKEEMYATIENDFGTITRKRTKNENQYIVNDKVLNVVKSDVPDEVNSVLRLSDTNIQKQLDSPFMLSNTSGEVAKYFNKVVRLDIIDKVLTNAESKRRKTKLDIENVTETIEVLERKEADFDWLDDVEQLLTRYDTIKSRNDNLRNEIDIILAEIEKYNNVKNRFEKFNEISSFKNKLKKIDILKSENEEIEEQIENISDGLNKYKNCRIYPDFSEQKKIIEELEKCSQKSLDENIKDIQQSIQNYENQKLRIETSEKEVSSLKKQLPEICPICGSPMKNNCC